MKKYLLLLVISLAALLLGCNEDSTDPKVKYAISHGDTSEVISRKPNIYIYPTKELKLTVNLSFPNGGQLLESIPNYGNGWEISVKTNGIINETYHYLFYECKFPDMTQNKFGWLVANTELEQFFRNNMSLSGFNENEIKDFTEYWIPLLKDYKYYEIYPQYKNTLDKMSFISFSETPLNIFRLQYVIKGRNDNNIILLAPQLETARREGFFVMEWGVILKQ
jgi:hypothetical protein